MSEQQLSSLEHLIAALREKERKEKEQEAKLKALEGTIDVNIEAINYHRKQLKELKEAFIEVEGVAKAFIDGEGLDCRRYDLKGIINIIINLSKDRDVENDNYKITLADGIKKIEQLESTIKEQRKLIDIVRKNEGSALKFGKEGMSKASKVTAEKRKLLSLMKRYRCHTDEHCFVGRDYKAHLKTEANKRGKK